VFSILQWHTEIEVDRENEELSIFHKSFEIHKYRQNFLQFVKFADIFLLIFRSVRFGSGNREIPAKVSGKVQKLWFFQKSLIPRNLPSLFNFWFTSASFSQEVKKFKVFHFFSFRSCSFSQSQIFKHSYSNKEKLKDKKRTRIKKTQSQSSSKIIQWFKFLTDSVLRFSSDFFRFFRIQEFCRYGMVLFCSLDWIQNLFKLDEWFVCGSVCVFNFLKFWYISVFSDVDAAVRGKFSFNFFKFL